MESDLQQHLHPGERVLYHPRQGWLCADTVPYLLINFCCIAVLAVAGLITFDLAGLVALASVVGSILGFALWGYPRNAPSEAMVTDRRLMQICGLLDSRLIEVRASVVKRVVAHEDVLRVFCKDGTAVKIRHPNSSLALGMALAYAAEVPPPRLTPPLEQRLEDLWLTCVVFAAIAIGVFSLKWLFLAYGGVIFSFSLGLGVGAFVLGGLLANLVGIFLGGILCLILARPFLSYDELRSWLDNGEAFLPLLDDEENGASLQQTHIWFADWLYLRPRTDVERQG